MGATQGGETLALPDLKLHPPTRREGLLERGQLIGRLRSSPAGVVTVVAPAGYGKTLLMAEWMASENAPTAWLSIDSADNDPAALLADLVSAMTIAGMISEDDASRTSLTSKPAIAFGIPSLVGAVEVTEERGLFFIDNLDSLRSRTAWDVINALVHQLSGKVRLILASRAELRLPIASMRAEGSMVEVTTSDLALDDVESVRLLTTLGIEPGYDIDEMMRTTEGWPVGVYLVGLAMLSGSAPSSVSALRGDDVYVAEYVSQEILDNLSASKRSFLLRTSILDELSGPLCDAVLETTGSARTLESLEHSNLLIMRLDRAREWHRYHQMFQEVLRAELEVNEPEIVPGLHERAAEWFEENDQPEAAIRHAQEAGDVERVARLVELIGRVTYTTGRSETVFGWLEWLERQGPLDGHPGAAAIGAMASALAGDTVRAERWTAAGDTSHPVALLVRALRTPSGIAGMLADVRRARDLMPPGSPWMPATYGVEGLAVMWEGDRPHADSLFHRAITMSEPLLATATATTALAGRALIALEERDWSGADTYCSQSLRMIMELGLEGYTTSALTFALAARLARKRNDIVRARDLLASAARLRPQLNVSLAGVSVQTNLELARCYLELSDVAGARLVLRDAQALIDQVPGLGSLPGQIEEVRSVLATMGPGKIGPSTLTTAELRLLPLLASHLTFPEIGDRLYISRHTVKTQAMSIYRKLGASSRSEAVKVATESGFLGDSGSFTP